MYYSDNSWIQIIIAVSMVSCSLFAPFVRLFKLRLEAIDEVNQDMPEVSEPTTSTRPNIQSDIDRIIKI